MVDAYSPTPVGKVEHVSRSVADSDNEEGTVAAEDRPGSSLIELQRLFAFALILGGAEPQQRGRANCVRPTTTAGRPGQGRRWLAQAPRRDTRRGKRRLFLPSLFPVC